MYQYLPIFCKNNSILQTKTTPIETLLIFSSIFFDILKFAMKFLFSCRIETQFPCCANLYKISKNIDENINKVSIGVVLV